VLPTSRLLVNASARPLDGYPALSPRSQPLSKRANPLMLTDADSLVGMLTRAARTMFRLVLSIDGQDIRQPLRPEPVTMRFDPLQMSLSHVSANPVADSTR
jgi:hypothetical protein